ncbi:MAG: N-formylglutamate amidohydrolase [Steroidobacteraceae bacterium]
MPLLAADEPAAFSVVRPEGRSRFVLACDHASRRIPRSLGTLGLSPEERSTHVAWDIGAAGVANRLSAILDAPLVLQGYSRLVIDCNRPPGAPTSIPASSEKTVIAGNHDLTPAATAARQNEIFEPYHAAIGSILDRRLRNAQPALIVAVHSFTPVYHDVPRPWHTGLMYRHDPRLAHALLGLLREGGALCVGDNEPYAITETTDYTLPFHGEKRGLPHVGIEIRQDLVGHDAGQQEWAERLARLLTRAAELIE